MRNPLRRSLTTTLDRYRGSALLVVDLDEAVETAGADDGADGIPLECRAKFAMRELAEYRTTVCAR